MKKNLEQERAKYALNTIKERELKIKGEEEKRERYLTIVKGLSASIIMNGLGQMMATLVSKENKDTPEQMLYEDISTWLCKNEYSEIYGEKDLMKAIVESSQNKYIKIQIETLKLLDWLKKFAAAYLSKEGE